MQQMIKISDNPDIETLNYLVDLVNKNDLSTANNKVKNLTKNILQVMFCIIYQV